MCKIRQLKILEAMVLLWLSYNDVGQTVTSYYSIIIILRKQKQMVFMNFVGLLIHEFKCEQINVGNANVYGILESTTS